MLATLFATTDLGDGLGGTVVLREKWPVTKEVSAGSLLAAAAVIYCSSSRPRRPVMIAANARTCPARAASSGELVKMASRLAWSAGSRSPGLVIIQAVTALGW
jgi:hypothetical protein